MLADFPDLPGQLFQQHYAISELLSASSHRATYVGTTVDDTHPIVLLLLRPTLPHDAPTRDRFDHRVRASSRVKHPAIAIPVDSGETLDGKLWLVLEAGGPGLRLLALGTNFDPTEDEPLVLPNHAHPQAPRS